ncbi:chromosomal replication initiator protein DnaA [Anaeromyxobacter diazotrophicus]|uniref:Chromosomal replication initiator protein DnaA n=1 Tax=Anaeromyxobacter diazotrophicus TaxID=2590199 RepID=A0A7I9VMS0_9BACT|nr:chromosomal replication initiator protein DnaA [Anaeromyxobacter diazotrophicus]GEJ57694.1 chromosomal replication initiator protein DnaA [Anaeromyxobacter diazotrophicus]
MAAEEHWSRIEAHLRSRLRPDLFERWFAPLRPGRLEGDRLEVSAPDKFHRDFVDDNYRSFFEEFVPDLVGRRVVITFVVDDAPARRAEGAAPTPAPRPALTPAPGDGPRDGRPNPRYTFDTFVVGESNRFAFAAAQAVAAKPGQNYNPLFFHGDSGLGKTHLLHAIAHDILRSKPGARVAIVSSERYTNEFVEALSRGAGAMTDFRRKYRECGALLVDDVQFLAGRDKTAEEFFHTFNALHDHEVQIVLSSDRSPKELKGLEERLCSRFEWGMRVQIDVPEFETRAAILRKKAEVERIELSEPVASLLATHIKSNVRELEGALMRVAAFASLKSEPISESLARDVLGDVIPPPGYKPSIERIQEEVAKFYDLTVAKLTSPNREQKIALPRQVAMYLCRTLAGETLQQIADKFNKKDHTTVMAAEKRIRELLEADGKVKAEVETLAARLAP